MINGNFMRVPFNQLEMDSIAEELRRRPGATVRDTLCKIGRRAAFEQASIFCTCVAPRSFHPLRAVLRLMRDLSAG
jgi:hypothetical protein